VIVLDTHAWLWWVSAPQKLSAKAVAAIEYAKTVGLCPISCWELSTKVATGKLTLDRDLAVWVAQALARPRLEVLPLTPSIATAAGQLGLQGFHGDPADRLIVATALAHGAHLVTKDAAIRTFPAVETVW
jgi:PIN domain nuclease of toxin-antitoxin system